MVCRPAVERLNSTMKRRLEFLLVGLCAAACAVRLVAASPPCRVEVGAYRGWRALRLANGLVTLEVVPDIGGRVIQFDLGGHPFFFLNPALAGHVFPPEENGGPQGGWKNYGGSKVWPAPQGWTSDDQWPGPPDPVLDGGRYEGEIVRQDSNEVAVRLTGPADPRTGLQFSRVIRLFAGGTRVRLEHRMTNISARPLRWAIWEVTQLDTSDGTDPSRPNPRFWAYCPRNPRSVQRRGFLPLFGDVNHPAYQPDGEHGVLAVQYLNRVGKVGLDTDAGWLAAANGQSDHCFVGRFDYVPRAAYPDGCSVEFWLNGVGEFVLNGLSITNTPAETPYLMEAEILSPLVRLAPGQDYAFTTEWFAARCPPPLVRVTDAGVVHQPLAFRRHQDRADLGGVFGVFYQGRAAAVLATADGKLLGRIDLGAVAPDTVFRLSHPLALPEGTFRASLRVLDAAGQDRGELDEAVLR